jgi:acetyl esterase/lipase
MGFEGMLFRLSQLAGVVRQRGLRSTPAFSPASGSSPSFRRVLPATLALLTSLSACSPVALLNATVPRSTFRETRGFAYGPGARRTLDVYVPVKGPVHSDASNDKGRPIVVFFYGGSWQNGNRGDYLFVGEALASRGFVAVLPDYRTWPETAFPGFINDAAAAVRWAHDHASEFGGDPSRLFLMGHSAGAQMVVLLATDGHYLKAQQLDKSDVRGVVGLAGPYDFLPLTDPTLEDVFPIQTRAASQPINFVQGDEPPMFLSAGTRDTIVDPGNTDRLAAKMKASGDAVEVKHYRGLSHATLIGAVGAPLRGIAPVLDDVAHFIDSTSAAPGKAVYPAAAAEQTSVQSTSH